VDACRCAPLDEYPCEPCAANSPRNNPFGCADADCPCG
jgi:hypothetical protein